MPVLVDGSTVSGTCPKYRSAISCIVPVSGGTTDERMMPLMRLRSTPLCREELRDEDAELVGGPLAQRLQPPAVGQPLAVEHAEHDVGVAYVNRQ